MHLSNISDQIIVTKNIYKLNTVNSLMSILNYQPCNYSCVVTGAVALKHKVLIRKVKNATLIILLTLHNINYL